MTMLNVYQYILARALKLVYGIVFENASILRLMIILYKLPLNRDLAITAYIQS